MKADLQNAAPIGLFDSGIGGLTIARSIVDKLPNERIIYFGDTAHLPYGEKSVDAIRFYALKICKLLLESNCKMIVVACNTAAAAAYDVLLEFFQDKIHFVNVVDPLVVKASELAKRKVGIIATKTTVKSNIYKSKLNTLAPDLEVQQLATPLFVPMIEEGFHKQEISHGIIDAYLNHESLKEIDTLLLACTHYPLIRKQIESYYKDEVKVMDSMAVTAERVYQILSSNNLLASKRSDQSHEFYVSDYTESFAETTHMFFNEQINLQENAIW